MIKSKKKKINRSRLNLSLKFILMIFTIMFATVIIITLISLVLIKTGILNFSAANRALTLNSLTMMGAYSLVIGTVIGAIFSKVAVEPVAELIDATKKLSVGNFNVRINLNATKEFKALSESFNNMAVKLGSIEVLRTDFVNNFSHEFKTPIVSIYGFAKMIKSEGLSEKEKNEYLDLIISETKRLVDLSQNVLTLSRIENQPTIYGTTKYNISEQLRRTIILLENKWNSHGNNIVFNSDEILITANEDLMNQVFINLIDNAIKFSDANTDIIIKISENEKSVIILISDFGEKIDDNSIKRIFDKFYQGDTSHTTFGNGLGLSIVKKTVELHKGKVSVVSAENGKTTFRVELPKMPNI